MDFDYPPELEEWQGSLRLALDAALGNGQATTGDNLWRCLADLGACDLLSKQPTYEGLLAAGAAAEVLGERLVTVPWLETAVLGVLTGVVPVGPGAAAGPACVLPSIAVGPGPGLVVEHDEDHSRLHGQVAALENVDGAGLLLLAWDGGAEPRLLFAEPAAGGWSTTAHQRWGDGDPWTVVTVDTPMDSISGVDQAAEVLWIAEALRSLQMVGAARRVLAMTVDYAGERSQFGRAIGQFQAVQHLLADAVTSVELVETLSRYALHWAALRSTSGAADHVAEDWPVSPTAATRLAARQRLPRVAEIAIQVHGGAGFTAEFGVHRYLQALHDWSLTYLPREADAGHIGRLLLGTA